MSTYFTQHHFSPRWSLPHRFHHENVPHTVVSPPAHHAPVDQESAKEPQQAVPASPPTNEHHRVLSHETLSRFLHAFNTFNVPNNNTQEEHDIVHPHFDLVETKTSYAVYGELPGLGQEDVAVEANDHLFTLTVTGELKRPVPQQDTPTNSNPAPRTATDPVGAVHSKPEETSSALPAEEHPAAEVEATASTSIAEPRKSPTEEPTKKEGDQKNEHLEIQWHVKERRVGHFRRVFRFPVELVEMSAVKASMNHGLLCVIVPKREDIETYNKKVEDARKVAVRPGTETMPLFGYFF